jgi:hypothetical protein
MALNAKTLQATVFECTFCGSIHATEEEAVRHGCAAGDPQQRFAVGEVVSAKARIVAGMQLLAEHWVKARIAKISAPLKRVVPDTVSLARGWGCSDHNLILEGFALQGHDWVLTLEVLEEPPAFREYVLNECLQSEVRRI